MTKGKVSLTKIRRLMKLVNVKNILSLPLDVIKTQYIAAIEDYKKACKKSHELADTHMDSLDETMAKKSDLHICRNEETYKNTNTKGSRTRTSSSRAK